MSPKITREEWMDWLQERRVEVAKLPSSDTRRPELEALLKDFEEIERSWAEIDEHDPDLAKRAAEEINRILKD